MKLALIKYKSGNIRSVLFALERLGCEAILTADPEEIRSADKVIFPGVGEASSAMKQLQEKNLQELIPSLKQPVLGICLGMQLMCSHSEEGNTKGLDIFSVTVKKFIAPELSDDYPDRLRKFIPAGNHPDFKIPQMGWNSITKLKGPLFENIPEETYLYFVHSYYAGLCAETNAVTDYIQPFSAGLSKNNFHGVQFHPEKSGDAGEMIIRNFLKL